jgi:hypothetical protein
MRVTWPGALVWQLTEIRLPVVALAALVLCTEYSSAQTPTNASVAEQPSPSPGNGHAQKWDFSASVYAYFVPDSKDYLQPTFTADRDWVHLEARYNYEGLDTGSVWFGYNLGGGETLAWEFAPMLGGVFGSTAAIAPGYEGTVTWRKLQLYSEGEYVIDTAGSSGTYFYNWSELTLAPAEWMRFGLVTQHTRAYRTAREIQQGLFLGLSYKRLEVTGYVFNPDQSKATVVIALRVNF